MTNEEYNEAYDHGAYEATKPMKSFAAYWGTRSPRLLVERLIERLGDQDIPLVQDVKRMMQELEKALEVTVSEADSLTSGDLGTAEPSQQ